MSAMKLCVIYLAVLLSYCEAYKILVIFPLPSRSHGILGDGIVRNLLNDGHEVTYVAAFPYKPASPKLRLVDVSSNIDVMPTDMFKLEDFLEKNINLNVKTLHIAMSMQLWTKTLENKNVQKLLNDPNEQFDAVLAEWLFSELPAGIAAVFNCPFIWSSSTDIHWVVQRLIDQPSNPSYTEVIVSSNLVTYVAAFPYKPASPKLRLVDVSSNIDVMPTDMFKLEDFLEKNINLNVKTLHIAMSMQLWTKTLENKNVQKLLNDPNEQFDAVLAEWLFSELPAGYFDLMERREYDRLLAPIVEKRGRQSPSYYDLQFNASLLLVNTHVSVGQSVPLPQNVKPIGGYHIDEKVKPLPDDIKKILDNAENGVIYFSMGSNLKSKEIPKVIKDSLLKMFGELKQTVLWKFEEDLPNAPKNVYILNWAPQQSILSHPNTVLFITHGGLLSTTETIHFGVPIIGIPVFADQFLNVLRAVKRGYALKVDLSYTMADELRAAIEEVTNNQRYAEKAKELSIVYHDRPVSPGKEISHWVKHVIQTRGALHLRSPALVMPFYQKLYLDLLALIAIIIFTLTRLVKWVCCVYCSKKNLGSKKTN